ncbi:MAG: hypothetical protein IJW62_02120 [Clostridia bacterium]|nr:hypothetical protein [Clostridia bacterium]
MKKFGSILLTLAVLLTLCAGALPVYGATISISAHRTVLVVGQETSITVNFLTEDPLTYILTSSDESVVAVNDDNHQVVYAVSKGTAVITAKALDPDTNRTISASVTIKVRTPTGLLDDNDYYIMNCGTGKLLSLANSNDANNVSLIGQDRNDDTIAQWTLDIATDSQGYHTGVTQLISANSSANRRAYVSGTNLVLYNVSSARTKFAVHRIESGTNQGKYAIRYGTQYVAMNSSGTVYLTSSSSANIYWCFMDAHKGYADMYGFYVPDSHPDAVDSTVNLSLFASAFNALGYVADGWENETAAYAYELLPDDEICIINSHANTGIIYFFGDNGIDNGAIAVHSIVASDHLATSDQFIQFLNISGRPPENALASSRLIMYMGCLTGVDHTHDFVDYIKTYNLVNATFDKGAHCVIGLTKSVNERGVNDWLTQFINAIRSGQTIKNAINTANNNTNTLKIKNDDGTETAVDTMPLKTVGDTDQYLN